MFVEGPEGPEGSLGGRRFAKGRGVATVCYEGGLSLADCNASVDWHRRTDWVPVQCAVSLSWENHMGAFVWARLLHSILHPVGTPNAQLCFLSASPLLWIGSFVSLSSICCRRGLLFDAAGPQDAAKAEYEKVMAALQTLQAGGKQQQQEQKVPHAAAGKRGSAAAAAAAVDDDDLEDADMQEVPPTSSGKKRRRGQVLTIDDSDEEEAAAAAAADDDDDDGGGKSSKRRLGKKAAGAGKRGKGKKGRTGVFLDSDRSGGHEEGASFTSSSESEGINSADDGSSEYDDDVEREALGKKAKRQKCSKDASEAGAAAAAGEGGDGRGRARVRHRAVVLDDSEEEGGAGDKGVKEAAEAGDGEAAAVAVVGTPTGKGVPNRGDDAAPPSTQHRTKMSEQKKRRESLAQELLGVPSGALFEEDEMVSWEEKGALGNVCRQRGLG